MSASGPLLAGVDANASTPDTRRWSCVVSMVLLSCGAALLWSPQPVPGVSLLAVPRVLPRALATAQLVPSAQKSGPVPGSPAVQPRLGAQDRAEGSSPWVQRPPSGVWSAAPPTARSVPHPHAHAESHVHTQPQSHWSARVAVLLLLLMPFVPRLFRWRRRLSDSQHTVAMSAVFGRWADGKAGRARPQAGAREAPQPQGIDFSPGPWSDTVRNALQQHQRDGTPVDGVVLQRSDAGYFVQLSDLKILAFLPLSEATGALARRKAKGEGEGSRVSASDAEPQEVQVKISKLDLRAQSVTVSQKLVGTSKVFRVHKGVVQDVKPTFVLVKIGTRLNAVLRASEISHRPVADPGQVFSPGDKIKCMLLPGAFSEGVKDNVLVSTKALEPTPGDMLVDPAAVYRQAEATAKQLEEAFRPGTVHEGTVSIVNPYAVIVSMGVLGGILHVSQISNDHVASAADVFKVGDKIKCMVRKVEAWRLSLSTKELEPAPGDMLRDRALVFATAEARAKQVQTTFEVGAVLEGVVTRIKPVGVFVNIGGVREGLLHVSQISNAFVADIRNLFTVGEKVKCMVIASDEEQARVQLSTKTLEPTPGDMLKDSAGVYQNAEEVASKLFAAGDGRAGVPPNAPPARALKETLPTQAATHSEWGEAVRDCLRQSRREDATFNCVLLRRGQDGYFGVVSDVPGMAELAAFLPFNEATEGLGGPQLSGPVAEAFFRQQLEVPVKICDLDLEQQLLIVSQKMVNVAELFRLHKGVVSTVQHNAVVVDIGAEPGAVLHVSEISHNAVADAREVFRVGDKLRCMVLPGAFVEGRVPVSTKALEPAPGDMLTDPALVYEKAEEMVKGVTQAFRPGSLHEGTVTHVEPYAAIVSMGVLAGILHVSQISNDHVASAADVFKVGDKIKCMVRRVEPRRISLSTKELEPAPGDMLRDRALVFAKAEARARQLHKTFEVGAVLEGVVTRVQGTGVHVDIGGVRDGLLHASRISKVLGADPRRVFAVGDRVKCMVVAADPDPSDPRSVQLSTKILEPAPGDMLTDPARVYARAEEVASRTFQVGTVLEGIVTRIVSYGVFVDIGGMRGSLLHISQISKGLVPDVNRVFAIGDRVKAVVIDNRDRHEARVLLSTKELEPVKGDMIRDPAAVYEKAEAMAEQKKRGA